MSATTKINATTKASEATTVTVSTATFLAWRKKLWSLRPAPLNNGNWRHVMALQELHLALGDSAGAALDAARDIWRNNGAEFHTFPQSAVTRPRRDAGWRDDEDYKGATVELAAIDRFNCDHANLYGGCHDGDPAELVARVVTVTGIEAE